MAFESMESSSLRLSLLTMQNLSTVDGSFGEAFGQCRGADSKNCSFADSSLKQLLWLWVAAMSRHKHDHSAFVFVLWSG